MRPTLHRRSFLLGAAALTGCAQTQGAAPEPARSIEHVGFRLRELAVSHDAARIAIGGHMGDSDAPTLFTLERASGQLTRYHLNDEYPGQMIALREPSFAPDGRLVVRALRGDRLPNNNLGLVAGPEIVFVGGDDAPARRLRIPRSAISGRAIVNPASGRIGFWNNERPVRFCEIDAGGGPIEPFAEASFPRPHGSFAYAPDGQSIVFVGVRAIQPGDERIWRRTDDLERYVRLWRLPRGATADTLAPLPIQDPNHARLCGIDRNGAIYISRTRFDGRYIHDLFKLAQGGETLIAADVARDNGLGFVSSDGRFYVGAGRRALPPRGPNEPPPPRATARPRDRSASTLEFLDLQTGARAQIVLNDTLAAMRDIALPTETIGPA